MPTLLFKELGLVKGTRFDSWRRVGSPMQAVKVYNLREVDELVFLDISATTSGRGPDLRTIDELADECFMPLSAGGGVSSVEDVRNLLRIGADKVTVNSALHERPGVISESAAAFGSQCIIASIDASRRSNGRHEVYIRSGSKATGVHAVDAAVKAAALGAGEILLTSIDRDGTMEGYDIDLVRSVTSAVNVPVIASGGAGNYEHLAEALREGKAQAVAAASIFHFTELTPLGAKRYLKNQGFNVRV